MAAEDSTGRDRLPPGWLEQADTKSSVLAELAQRRVARRRRRTIGTGAAALLVFAAGFAAWRLAATRPAPATVVVKALDRETLPDGSVVERKGGAAFTVDFSGVERRIVLLSGAAHFEVARNPERPFVVVAGGVSVRAVGTAFSVEFQPAQVEVLVTEGRVAVASGPVATAASPTATTVDAGAGLRVALDATAGAAVPAVAAIDAIEFERKLAWRVRKVEFSSTPLAEAIEILNRYNRVQFVLADPSLASTKLSGVMRADRIQGVIRLLSEECGIRAERRGDAAIVLHRARP